MSQVIPDSEQRSEPHSRIRQEVLVGALATAGAVVLWLMLVPIGGVDLDVRNDQRIGLASVVVTALVVELFAMVLLHIVRRRARRPIRAWTWIAVCVFLVSLLGPLGGVNASARLSLAALHLVVALTTIVGVRRVVKD